ncbi:MAG: hypothetical protein ACLUVC_08055 [Longibaculum sp.]
MCRYKIVYLKEKTKNMVEHYPSLLHVLYSSQRNAYESKQVELFFQPISYGKEKLLQMLNQREDYSYFHGVHQIHNPITDDIIAIKMNEFDIEVEENGEKFVIFEIIKGFSQNFYMFRT